MTRYYFNLSDGTRERDETGTMLRDAGAAQREAVRYAGEVLKDEPERLQRGAMSVDVEDEARKLAFAVEVRLIYPDL